MKEQISQQQLKIAIETFDPFQAQQTLDNKLPNRKLSAQRVNTFVWQIVENEYRGTDTAEPIKFDQSGRLLDGQHRLAAVVKSGRTVPFWVARGLPSDIADVLDTGRSRNAYDALVMSGHKYTRVLASAAHCVRLFEQKRPNLADFTSVHEIKAVVERHPTLEPYIAEVLTRTFLKNSALVAALFWIEQTNTSEAHTYADAITWGKELSGDDPAYHARQRIIDDRKLTTTAEKRNLAVAMLFRAFELRLEGKTTIGVVLRKMPRDYPWPKGAPYLV